MMRWTSRRKSRGEGKKGQKDFAEKKVTEYASRILHNRWALLCPFPLNKREIYEALFTADQHRAIDLMVRTTPSMVNMTSEVYFDFDLPVRVKVQGRFAHPEKLKINFGCNFPLPDTGGFYSKGEHRYLASQLPPYLREPLHDWSQRWLVASRETNETVAKLTRLFDVCGTMGQIKRVWPNACNLLPDSAQAALREAKVRSKYPDAVLECIGYKDSGEGIHQLREEWRPDSLTWFDDRLTEALCLPLDPDSDPSRDAAIHYTTLA